MQKESLYLDTSVPSAYFDDRWPERQRVTRDFWTQAMPDFNAFISPATIEELRNTPQAARRDDLLQLVRSLPRLPISPAAEVLADDFIQDGLVPAKKPFDALHLALAVVYGMDMLVTWNFVDMINLHTKRLLPMLSAKHGYFKQLLIVSPQEFGEVNPS
jgi:predicted nucleic acid-binding protein